MAQRMSDERLHGRREKRRVFLEARAKYDLKTVMEMPEGRRMIHDFIFNRCKLMAVFNAQDSGIYRHEGKRAVGQGLARELQEENPDLYLLMISEMLEDAKQDAALTTAAEMPSDDPEKKPDAS